MEQEKIENQQEQLNKVVDGIRDSYRVDIIKDREIIPILDMNNMQKCGCWMKLHLNSCCSYSENTLAEWKNKLGATEWIIMISKKGLYVAFCVYFNEE